MAKKVVINESTGLPSEWRIHEMHPASIVHGANGPEASNDEVLVINEDDNTTFRCLRSDVRTAITEAGYELPDAAA